MEILTPGKFRNRYVIIAFVAGLLVGPLATSSLGWQINPEKVGEAETKVKIEQQVKFCIAAAKASGKLDQNRTREARFSQAREWATMPWQKAPDEKVFNECYNSLG